MNSYNNKNILITGCCGTIGKELIEQLISSNDYQPSKVIGIDINESGIFFLNNKYENKNLEFITIDICDRDSLNQIMKGVDVILHCAAMKHVRLNELNPDQAIRVNVVGLQNIISTAISNNVKKVIFTSSDKAVNPTNIMGTSKLLGEKLITAANLARNNSNTIFASTRFGNVLGSNGSVVEVFKNQISEGKPLTLTSHEMTRFVMSIKTAAILVLESGLVAKGGEVFVTKMPTLRITDLAEVMIRNLSKILDHQIIVTGIKEGEKLYEELVSDDEVSRTFDNGKYFVIKPPFNQLNNENSSDYSQMFKNFKNKINKTYVSSRETKMTHDEILKLLTETKII